MDQTLILGLRDKEMKITDILAEAKAKKTRLDPSCWTGYHKAGTKVKGDTRVNNCVPNESVAESKERCPQCGMPDCTCAPGKCKCKPIAGWVPGKGFKKAIDEAANAAQQAAIAVNMKKAGKKPKKVDESFNGEYDDEAGMADNNIETMKRAVDGLDNLIHAGDNLPEWCQEKIAVAKSMLVTVWDYMASEEGNEDPEIAEMYEAMESFAEEVANTTQTSVDAVWETFEAMDDRALFETAAWRRSAGKSKKGGLNAKGVASYRRENPGSKLQMAVTTKPSKLKSGSKASKRRKSFCARMGGVKGPMKKPNGEPSRKALALRKWNC